MEKEPKVAHSLLSLLSRSEMAAFIQFVSSSDRVEAQSFSGLTSSSHAEKKQKRKISPR